MKQPHQYRPLEQQPQHDACGIGAVVNISGQRTHETLDGALKIVEKLEHRTGKDADGITGDGVGIMTQIPHAFFEKTARQAGKTLPEAGDYGVAMIFFPQDPLKRMRSRKLLEMILSREGLELLFWRDVPVCPEILSEKARSSMPYIAQCFIRRPDTAARGLDFDRRLYLARREYEHSVSGTYVVSMSSRTIVYKGLFLVWQLRQFYPDLQDADYTSALALVHSRFSTNTTPSWKRAHPNRIILHNGEINTIRGNINRMLAREETMASSILGDTIARAYPVVETDGSDSSMLDNTLEFLMYSGIELPKAVMLCIPEPWGRDKNMPREKRDMFHYYATMMEPWDGPAAILFSDGEIVGAVLDRNGLSNVPIEHISGSLTDHYDPSANVVRLSDDVYGSTSTVAIGVACHEVGHAMVTALQKNTEPVQKITIVPRTMGALGYTLQTPEEEKYLQTRDELLAKITTYMAGRAAEVLVFQSATSGAANDIEQATAIARAMVTQYGMSDKFGMMCLATVENQYLDNRAGLICGEDTAAQIDKEVLAIINHAYDEAIRLLTENREVLDHIAEYLYEHETITGKEFMKIFRELKGIPEPEDEAEKKTFFEQAEEARQELEEGKTAAESQNMDDVLLRNTQDHEEQ